MSANAPFHDGWSAEIGGVHFRVVGGVKSWADLRVDWHTNGAWRPVPMDVAAMLTDFFCENEDRLYPQDRGYLGSQKFTRWLTKAKREGWRTAVEELHRERARRDEQRRFDLSEEAS